MGNDAKLGLVLGLAVVMVIGLVFFKREPAGPSLASGPPGAVQTQVAPMAEVNGSQ